MGKKSKSTKKSKKTKADSRAEAKAKSKAKVKAEFPNATEEQLEAGYGLVEMMGLD